MTLRKVVDLKPTIEQEFILDQIAIFVRAMRKRARYSQTVLAEKVGVSRGYIGQIETSQCTTSIVMLGKICKVCGARLKIEAHGPHEGVSAPLGVFLVPHKATVLSRER